MILDLKDLNVADRQNYLQHAIAPRPICLASTIDLAGNVNLSPFSFFNLFSTQPPIAIFSPARRARDNTTKHTLHNVHEIPEVVINIVDIDILQQTSLASCEFPKEINEFIKAGFTEEPSTRIRPPMVKESKIKFECIVQEIRSLGTEGGAGNLVICEILMMHIDEGILDQKNFIDQTKIQHVARLGGDWYCKIDTSNLFMVEKPNIKIAIGIDHLPAVVRNSVVFSGNDLGKLANVFEVPAIDPTYDDPTLRHIFQYYAIHPEELEQELHRYAKRLLLQGKVEAAWQVVLSA